VTRPRVDMLPYDPDRQQDRYQFLDTIVRLHLAHLARTTPFRVEWVDAAWWLASQSEAAVCRTRAS